MAVRSEALFSPQPRRPMESGLFRSNSQYVFRSSKRPSPKPVPSNRHSTVSSPEKERNSAIFPAWLLNRKDFQDLSSQYGNIASIDVWEVCRKQPVNRNKLEKRAVLLWMADSPFLTEMKEYQLADVCDRFQSEYYLSGSVLVRQGEQADCLYLLVEGSVGIYTYDGKLVDCVYPKNVVGELGVQFKMLRTATIVAISNVKVFRLSLEDYESALFKLKLQHFKDHSRFLRNTAFFAQWDKAKVDRLASALMVKSYKKGQVVYRPGEEPLVMFVVRSGFVSLETQATLQRVNQWPISPKHHEVSIVSRVYQRTLRECRPGDVFGECEMLESRVRSCVAACSEESVLFVIRKESIEEIFTEKERLKLKNFNIARPPTDQIKTELEAEHTQAYFTRNALLNGIEANFLPSTRALPYKALRKQHLAKMFILRHRSHERRKLIRQEKSVEVVDRIQARQ